jgi:hypothetical protein
MNRQLKVDRSPQDVPARARQEGTSCSVSLFDRIIGQIDRTTARPVVPGKQCISMMTILLGTFRAFVGVLWVT